MAYHKVMLYESRETVSGVLRHKVRLPLNNPVLRGFRAPVSCWVFRRIGSRVPPGVIEVLAAENLTQKFGLAHKDPVELILFGRT